MFSISKTSQILRILFIILSLSVIGCSPRGDKAPLSSRNGADGERVRELLTRIAKNPADADARLQLATIHEENGHFMAAIESLRAAEAHGHHGPELNTVFGKCLSRLGRYVEAGKRLEEALSAEPSHTEAGIELASVLAKLGKKEEAVKQLRTTAGLVLAGAGSEPHILSLARSFEALGDLESALAWAEGAVRAAPTVAEGHFIAGRVLLKMDRNEKASERLVKAVELQPESSAARELFGDALAAGDAGKTGALERWLEAIELKSARPQTYYRAAEVLKGRGETRRAAEVLMRAGVNTHDKARAFRDATSLWKKEGDENQTLYSQATWMAAEGKYEKALVSYAALAKSPDSQWKSRGLDGVAEIYRLLNQPEQALAASKKAAISGTAADDLRLANAYLLLGEAARREEYLRRAMKKDPNLAGAVYSELGIIAESRKQPNKAIDLYQKATESDPGNIDALLALSRLYLTDGRTTEDWNLGVEKAAQASAAAPNDWRAFNLLGMACSKVGGHERAKQAYQHAIDLNPRDPALYRRLAAEYRALGDAQAAAEANAIAVRLGRKSKTRIGE